MGTLPLVCCIERDKSSIKSEAKYDAWQEQGKDKHAKQQLKEPASTLEVQDNQNIQQRIGFINQGENCWFNAALQCIINLNTFRTVF